MPIIDRRLRFSSSPEIPDRRRASARVVGGAHVQFRCRSSRRPRYRAHAMGTAIHPRKLLARFRRIPPQERRAGIEIYYPRVPGSIEYHTHRFDARLALSRVRALARSIHREWPFDLIHAHFIYPDGVVASQIGRELGVPVMTSEHAFWLPWLVDQPNVGAQVAAALPRDKTRDSRERLPPQVDRRLFPRTSRHSRSAERRR